MAQKKNPVLELSTDITRDYVLIDKTKCFIKSRDELSIVDLHFIQRRFKKIHQVFVQEELTDEEVKAAQDMIDEFLDFIFVDAPAEILSKLTEGHKMQIVTVFTNLFLESQPKEVKEEIQKMTEEMTEKGEASATPSQ